MRAKRRSWRLLLKCLLCISGAGFAVDRAPGKYINALDLLVDVYSDRAAEPCPRRHVQLLDGRCELSWEDPSAELECRFLQGPLQCDGRYYGSGVDWSKYDESRSVSLDTGHCYGPDGKVLAEGDADWWSSHFLTCENEAGRAVKPPGDIRVLSRIDEEDMQRLRDLVAGLPPDAWQLPSNNFGQTERPKWLVNYTQAVFHFPKHKNVEFSPYQIFSYASKVHGWIEPMLLQIARRYNYEQQPLPAAPGFLWTSVPRLFLASLGPDMQQAYHVDAGGSSQRPHKIHVPVIENTEATLGFVVDRETRKYHMPSGYAYEVNNQHKHFAENLGDGYRVHLIFEYMPVDVSSTETDEIGPDDHDTLQRKWKAGAEGGEL